MTNQVCALLIMAPLIITAPTAPAQAHGPGASSGHSRSYGSRAGGYSPAMRASHGSSYRRSPGGHVGGHSAPTRASPGASFARSSGGHAASFSATTRVSQGASFARSSGGHAASFSAAMRASPGASFAMPSGTQLSGFTAATRPSNGAALSAPMTLVPNAQGSSRATQSFAPTVGTNRTATTVGGRVAAQTPSPFGSQSTGASVSTLLPNNLSGALPDSNTAAPVETATTGGKARVGATGHTMPTCMAAWDPMTHITRPRWRQICARTLVSPHI